MTTPVDPTVGIQAIGVVVPAHNEEATLGRCLQSILIASAHPDLRDIPIRITTVLDACRDGTGEVALRFATAAARRSWPAVAPAVDLAVVEVAAANVGLARAAGCDDVLSAFSGADPSQVWLATTDADTVVPPGWLSHHVDLRRRGADGCTGTVRVTDWSEQPDRAVAGFADRYLPVRTRHHDHVHGANLGFTAEAYRAAGGFRAWACGEDHALCQAMRREGSRVQSTMSAPVITSARRESRVAGGFSDFLRGLDDTSDGDDPRPPHVVLEVVAAP